MTSFLIGRMVEPETKEITIKSTGEVRKVFSFGLLSGKNCVGFEVFDNDKAYKKATTFKDGDNVLALVGSSVGKNGQLRTYLNGIAACPNQLQEQLRGLVTA